MVHCALDKGAGLFSSTTQPIQLFVGVIRLAFKHADVFAQILQSGVRVDVALGDAAGQLIGGTRLKRGVVEKLIFLEGTCWNAHGLSPYSLWPRQGGAD